MKGTPRSARGGEIIDGVELAQHAVGAAKNNRTLLQCNFWWFTEKFHCQIIGEFAACSRSDSTTRAGGQNIAVALHNFIVCGLDTLRKLEIKSSFRAFNGIAGLDSSNYRHIRRDVVIHSMSHPSCRLEDARRARRRQIIEIIWFGILMMRRGDSVTIWSIKFAQDQRWWLRSASNVSADLQKRHRTQT